MVKPCQASGAIQGMDPLSVWDNVSSLLNRVSTQPCRFMNSGGHCFVVFGRFEDIPITKPVFPFSDKTVVASPLGTSKISKFCTQLLSNARTNACVHVGNCIITGVSPGHHAESAMPGNALKCLSASSTQHHCHRGISTLTHSHSPKICGSSLLDEAF